MYFPILENTCKDLSMNFILGLSYIQMRMDCVFIIVDKFLKMVYVISCKKTNDVLPIA
jgi:hypothetical protein